MILSVLCVFHVYKQVKKTKMINHKDLKEDIFTDDKLNFFFKQFKDDKKAEENANKHSAYIEKQGFMNKSYRIGGLFKTYPDYLASSIWKERRNHLIEKKGKCEICGKTKRLEVHHLSYENVGDEKERDLQVLCRSCHQKQHSKLSLFGEVV